MLAEALEKAMDIRVVCPALLSLKAIGFQLPLFDSGSQGDREEWDRVQDRAPGPP